MDIDSLKVIKKILQLDNTIVPYNNMIKIIDESMCDSVSDKEKIMEKIMENIVDKSLDRPINNSIDNKSDNVVEGFSKETYDYSIHVLMLILIIFFVYLIWCKKCKYNN
jgi:hypothetical protein